MRLGGVPLSFLACCVMSCPGEQLWRLMLVLYTHVELKDAKNVQTVSVKLGFKLKARDVGKILRKNVLSHFFARCSVRKISSAQ